MATITGTPNDDTLEGDDYVPDVSSGDDTIHGLGGNDRIDGLGGTNQIFGDGGDDVIFLTRFAGSSVDIHSTINGGEGTDTLDMSGGTAPLLVVETTPGNGIFAVGRSTGVLFTNEVVSSGSGIEHFVLGPQYSALLLPNWTSPLFVEASYGNDRISTGIADDTIVGGANGDVITLNGGNDVVTGGNGTSAFVIGRISGNADHIQIHAGTQDDTLDFENAALLGQTLSVDLRSGVATLGATTITFTGIENISLGGSAVLTTLYGDDSANVVLGQMSDFAVEAHGRGGGDNLSGGSAGDSFYGDDGDDYLYGYGGNDLLQGGAGDDHIAGGEGDNRLDGGDGHDWLEGNAEGNFDGGRDTIDGGAGNDHIWGYMQAGSNNAASDLADLINAGDGSDYVNGNAGNDTIFGGAGADRLRGGAGNDSIDGGDGPDQINGNKGNDTIDGGEGNDLIFGGEGDDDLTGGSGNDNVLGDFGNDTLRAGAGVDIFTGGAGADLFDFSAAGAASIDPSGYFTAILDFASGTDRIDLGFTPGASDVLYSSTSFVTEAEARLAAQTLLTDHAGTSDVAVLQVGSDSYLFYNAAGAGNAITAIVALNNVAAAGIDATDFS